MLLTLILNVNFFHEFCSDCSVDVRKKSASNDYKTVIGVSDIMAELGVAYFVDGTGGCTRL